MLEIKKVNLLLKILTVQRLSTGLFCNYQWIFFFHLDFYCLSLDCKKLDINDICFFFFSLVLSLYNISGGVRISISDTAGNGDVDYGDYDNNERLLWEICGQLTKETLLIQAMSINVRADGFGDYQYVSQPKGSRVVGHYKAEQRNITDITGTCKTYAFSSKAFYPVSITKNQGPRCSVI